jgi:Kef-type K+ transport system membrane component KefB
MLEAARLVGTILAVVVAARLLGLLAVRLRQPSIVGEILAGVLLGPTLLDWARPSQALGLLVQLSAGFFLFSAGMEVDLSAVRRRTRSALFVGASGILFPFALGFGTAWAAPDVFASGGSTDRVGGAVFFGIALSISALPVIIRTLMNLGLYRTDFGMTVVAAAVIDDLAGWTLFGFLVARFSTAPLHGLGPEWTIAAAPLLALLMLTVVRRGADRALPHLSPRVGARGVAALGVLLALGAGAAAHFAGVHAMFGAFLAGVALGDSQHLPERTRATVTGVVERFFAPLFFGCIALKADFARDFDPALCGLVLLLACLTKILGCALGARLAGEPVRSSWALGFAMNSRGAMEIVLGALALDAGLIGRPMFVALVLMALATSLSSGPVIARLLRPVPSS